MSNELIYVKQLPVIEEQLQMVKKTVADRVAEMVSLVCTTETLQSVKKTRTTLNAEFKQWEEKRLAVKKQIMKPYENFEAVYDDCVKNEYRNGIEKLNDKIKAVEDDLKKEKELKVARYFYEYAASCGIDFVTFEDAGININLSAGEKKLKEAAKAYIDKVCEDLDIIDAQSEYADEMRVEYKNSRRLSDAITTVVNRHIALEREKEAANQTVTDTQPTPKSESEIPLSPPKIEENNSAETSETYAMTFRVYANLKQLQNLKKYLIDNNIKFEGSNN